MREGGKKEGRERKKKGGKKGGREEENKGMREGRKKTLTKKGKPKLSFTSL